MVYSSFSRKVYKKTDKLHLEKRAPVPPGGVVNFNSKLLSPGGASEALQKLKIDDPVEAFPVHGACGIWGTIAVPLCRR